MDIRYFSKVKHDLHHTGPLEIYMNINGKNLTIRCIDLADILYYTMTGLPFTFTTGRDIIEVWSTRVADGRIQVACMKRQNVGKESVLHEIDIFKYFNMLN